MTTKSKQRGKRRTLTGVVTSKKSAQTITVEVTRTYKHAKYEKYVRKQKRCHAHDAEEQAGIGDVVEIGATRPLSKIKRWRLVGIVEAAPDRGVEVEAAAITGLGDQGGGES